uniref:Huntingtin interacting protein 1 related n=1 Tax=Poecilia reticulata TaxID=8081 RepID=A0A3P9PW97_POERE
NTAEVPPKEKYVRNIILGTHKEGGATTFWSYVPNLPLSSQSLVSWKVCYLLHKVLREGHRNVTCRVTSDVPQQHKVIPGNLEASDDTLEREAGTDMTKMDANGAKSTTLAGQCRLTPLIPLILDCSYLYHFSVRLLFKLHSREWSAFRCYLGDLCRITFSSNRIQKYSQFFNRAREIEFFKSIIQIPDLPDGPPNFLRAAALAEYKKPVVLMPGEDRPEEDEVDTQPELRETPQTSQQHYLVSQMGGPEASLDYRDTDGNGYKRELEALKPEVELIKSEAQKCMIELKSQVNRLEAELQEQRSHRQVALVENEHLRMEVEALRSANVANVGAQIGYKEADSRAQAAEVRFTQLKERHAELVTSHADLMKKNAETVKMLSSTKFVQDDLLRAKQQLESEVENLRLEKRNAQEVDRLNKELLEQRAEMAVLRSTLESKEQGSQVSSSLTALQAERDLLLRSAVEKDEAELSSLRQQALLHHSTLEQERQRSSMELGSLRSQMQQQLAQKLQDEQFCLLQCAVVEAEGIILDAVAKLDDPIHVRCISSPDYLINRAEITLGSIDKMQQSHLVYLGNRNDASGLLRAVTQFSHLAADTIVNGSATSHSAPVDHANGLTDSCRECANHCLQYLNDLKSQANLQRANPSAIRYTVQRILAMGQELRPKGQDVLKEELGSMVDKEMVATSTAIEEAVLRMDHPGILFRSDEGNVSLTPAARCKLSLTKIRQQDVVVFYSVQAVHILVTAATDLQKDIVEGGRGAASVTEFYAKNSRWTEGLISASKAVGWGATQLLDSADRVVGEKGSYEELIASSHEIAASTAQLVAASKVKADRNNKKLYTLQQASRHVNDMAAVVVTSTKHGQQQISDHGVMDFSGMSLIKLKKEEMEAQVKVLQLENQLDQERVRLGELRKRHYELGGPGSPDDDSFPPPPPPTLLDPTSPSSSFSHTQPFTSTPTGGDSEQVGRFFHITIEFEEEQTDQSCGSDATERLLGFC